MFENLSNREKKLLLAIGALLPIAIVFLGVFQITGAYEANNQELGLLDSQIVEQEGVQLEGMLAGRRQTYYASTSFPPTINLASSLYRRWINNAMDESNLTLSGITGGAITSLKSENKIIGRSRLFDVTANGTLAEINAFLSKFYELDMLHRIPSLTLTPQVEGRTKIRTGILKARMKIEILSLEAGIDRDNYQDFRRHIVDSDKDYNEILRRNIFGPGNNEPVLKSADKTTTAGRGRPYSFPITATDADKKDLLTFKLVKSSIPKAALKQARPTSRSAQFEMPDVKPGDYDFEVKVSDNGYPPKSSTEQFTVVVKKKPEPTVTKADKKVEKPKDEPEVDLLQLVKVTGITSDRDGKWRVWLSVPTGEPMRLTVGESFKLNDKEYEVISVNEDEAKFAGDEKTFIASPDFRTRGKLKEIEL